MPIANKKVLVTGAAGFIGSHLTRRLVELGADVHILTKYNSIFDNIRLCDIWDKINVIEADVRNLDSLAQVRRLSPQVVFHLAAYNHVGDSFLHVTESLDSNLKGTANLLESYDRFERFVYTSTSEVYGFQEHVPFAEDQDPVPISPYSIGKYAGELYCRMKIRSGSNPLVVLRPFNTFGPYQSPRAIISEIILKCLRNDAILATAGVQTREFNYVSNIVDAFILAAEKEEAVGQIINVGATEEIAVRDLIHMIHQLSGSQSELKIGTLPYRPTEIWRMAADNTKAKSLLGWQPAVPFEQGLIRTIAWFRRFIDVYGSPTSPLHRLAAPPAQ